MAQTICPGCGEQFPHSNGATHDYIGASPGCWTAYGELLAREYSDMAYMRAHQHTVDAYTVQHPGVPGKRSIQSVGTHLISLYARQVLEYSMADLPQVRQQAVKLKSAFTWLEPPTDMGQITVKTVLDAEDAIQHNRLGKDWAQQMWQVWEPHHAQIIVWAKQAGIT